MDKNVKASGRWQHRYLKNFRKNENGKYVYTGGFYDLCREEDKPEDSHPYRKISVSMILSAVMTTGTGMVPMPGNGLLWIILTQGAAFLCVLICLWKLFDLVSEKLPLKDYVYERTVPVYPVVCAVYMVCCILASASSLVTSVTEIAKGHPAGAGMAALSAILSAGAAVFSGFSRSRFKTLKWRRIINKNENAGQKS